MESLRIDENFKHLASGYPYKPYEYLLELGVGQDKINTAFENEIALRIGKNPEVVVRYSQGSIDGLILFRELEFDTNILGKKTGKIDFLLEQGQNIHRTADLISDMKMQLLSEGFEYVTYRFNNQDIETKKQLQQAGFVNVDEYNILLAKLAPLPDFPHDPNIQIREARIQDVAVLQDAIAPIFIHSRFFTDPKISKDSAVRMHKEWIANSFAGKVADHVLVAECDEKPVGFITLEMDKDAKQYFGMNIGHIPLIGTDPLYRGRYIGLMMTAAAFKGWFQEQGAEYIRIETQETNIPANKTYINAGFKLVDKAVTYRWAK